MSVSFKLMCDEVAALFLCRGKVCDEFVVKLWLVLCALKFS